MAGQLTGSNLGSDFHTNSFKFHVTAAGTAAAVLVACTKCTSLHNSGLLPIIGNRAHGGSSNCVKGQCVLELKTFRAKAYKLVS